MYMHQDVLDFITSKRVSVFAIEMPDGSPHAATVHFAYKDEPLTFIFLTSKRYRKSESLLRKEVSRASFVIGFEEAHGMEKTFQADGEARLLKLDDPLVRVYLAKFEEKQLKIDETDDIFFSFTPTWWRFTDYSGTKGKTVYNSDGTIV